MALERRPREQQTAWGATTNLPKFPGHVFYEKLNTLLAEAEFDRFVEDLCRPHLQRQSPSVRFDGPACSTRRHWSRICQSPY